MRKARVLLVAMLVFLSFPKVAFAHCPLCVAGAAAGVTLTRWVGVDDSITGVWLAAFLGAMSLWTYTFVRRKFDKPWLKPAIYILFFAATIWSFYKFQLVIRMSQIFGFDKLTFGMLTGGALFFFVDGLKLKHRFNYQKIVVSLGSMVLLSLVIFILINYFI